MSAATAERVPWEESVGLLPHKVTVMELATRKWVLYLRWRKSGNWKYQSLGRTLLDEKGKPLTGRRLEAQKKWAREQANQRYAALVAGLPQQERAAAAPITLGEAWALVSDKDTGLYPAETPHRKEVQRELQHAVRILDGDLTFAAVTRDHIIKLWRTRIRELRAAGKDGLRGAEITVARLIAVAAWLREVEKIPANACIPPKQWKKKLKADYPSVAEVDRLPKVKRPRHKPDEYRKLLEVAWDVDPRFGLMYALGAELRGGQVKRARRSDLELPPVDEEKGEYGTFTVPGIGNKRGTKVFLTKGQRAAVERALDVSTGYLRELEAARLAGQLEDYHLFPPGQLPGNRRHLFKPTKNGRARSYHGPEHAVATIERHASGYCSNDAWKRWFWRAEKKAGIPHVRGRTWYGGRRVAVDLAKKERISNEALEQHGGWADVQVPNTIYADEERDDAGREARDARARFRGEQL